MSSLRYYFALFALFVVKGWCYIGVKLENLSSTDIFDGQGISFKCTSYSACNKHEHAMFLQIGKIRSLTEMKNGSCTASGLLNDTSAYGYDCLGNCTLVVSMKNVSHDKDGYKVSCIHAFVQSNTITIHVKVRVSSVQMNYTNTNITVPENAILSLECKTSYSRPEPIIFWYTQDPNSPKSIEITNMFKQTTFTDLKDRLIASYSVLTFYPNRTINGWNIHCQATNVPNETVSSSVHFIDVIYPPDGPPKILEFSDKDIYKVIEGNKGNLSCYVTGGNPLPLLSWDCSSTSKQNVDNLTVRSNITWTAYRSQESCSCRSIHRMSNESTNVMLDILYPPSKPEFTVDNTYVTNTIKIIRYTPLTLFCKSDSNPLPDYTWSDQYTSAVFNRPLDIKNVTEDGHYSCTVNNTMTESNKETERRMNTSSIEVEVLFPPSLPELRYVSNGGPLIQNNVIGVVRGDSFSISCNTKGNPNPIFQWDNEAQHHLLNITSIKSSVNRTCNASNIMKETVGESRPGNAFATLFIDVLYPPKDPEIRLTASFTSAIYITDSLEIKEGDSFNLTCLSESRPISLYKWYINETEISNSTELRRNNISRKESGNYTCDVSNIMNRTFGKQEIASDNLTTFVNVLFFADVGVLTNKSIAEGHELSILCPVIPGNTGHTTIYWTRESDKKVWNQTELNIQNVTKNDKRLYTCTVYSELHPTVGNMTHRVKHSQFFLNVFYKSFVTKLQVSGHENEYPVTATESTSITFSCEIDSNPISTVAIILPNGTVLGGFETNIIEYTYYLSSCLDNGVFTCSGRNNYSNGQPATKYLQVDVYCTPMAQSLIENEIRTKLFVPVTLQFTALANPKPEFTWEMWTNLSWEQISNNGMFSISSSGLQSNLTVTNVTATGGYLFRLNIENSVGNFIQNFTVKPFDRPNQPTKFDYIPESLADISVTLTWEPGFNGGTPQTFAVTYTSENEQDWQNIILHDTGETVMELPIQDLTSSTYYVFEIFAENVIGSSGKLILRIRTKALKTTTEGYQVPVGAIMGSLFGVIAILGLVFGIFIYRKRYQKTKDRCNERTGIDRSNKEASEMKTIADRADTAGMDNVYEKIKPNEERGHAEKTEKEYEDLKAEKEDVGASNPIYTNLIL